MSDVVLVHGLWLDGSSWDAVVPGLQAAGHRVHAVTLPPATDSDAEAIGLQDHVDVVIGAIDAAAESVVLVGHSAGSGVAWGAVDARPDRVARAVFVGGWPTPDGGRIAPWFEPEGGVLALPDFGDFDESDLRDLDDRQLTAFRAGAVAVAGRVVTDPISLTDERRYQVPVTVVCPEFTAADLRGWVEAGEPPVAELARVQDVTYVDLPTGHWPQWTRPADLAQVVLDAAGG
jgi:pimeloyl-ACP methyl ester carboxylesterase